MSHGGGSDGPLPDETAPLGIPRSKFAQGRYVFQRLLGQGGMGIVWLAHDRLLDASVAIKILPEQTRQDHAALASLRKETSRSQRLSHPNIIRIHDLHEHEGDAFISMEYSDGANLSNLRCQQPNGIFAWEKLAPLTRQLCEGLAYAHGEKVIHRDLKPSNLMVDSKGRLKIADFGIAAVVNDTVARTTGNVTSGTLVYMSPQQIEGEKPSPADDLYALGATLYELLTSTPPFYTGEIVHQVLHKAPPTLRQRLADLGLKNEIPASVENGIMACLKKKASARPQSAGEVGRLLGVDSVHPYHPLVPQRTSRAKRAVTFIAAVILLAAFGLWIKSGKQDTSTQQIENSPRSKASDLSRNPPPGLASSLSEDGYRPMFDGATLDGWKFDDTGAWSIRNGALIGTASGKERYSLAYFNSDVPQSFELRWSMKVSNSDPNLGKCSAALAFRIAANERGAKRPQYQALIDDNFKVSMLRIHTDMGIKSGEQARIKTMAGAENLLIENKLAFTGYRSGDWNDCLLTAKGNVFSFWVNGKLACELIDQGLRYRTNGLIGLVVGSLNEGTATAGFKNLRIREVPQEPTQTVVYPSLTDLRRSSFVEGKSIANVAVFSDNFESFEDSSALFKWDRDILAATRNNRGTINRIREGTNHFIRVESTNLTALVALRKNLPMEPHWKSLKVSFRVRAQNLKTDTKSGSGAILALHWEDWSGVPTYTLAPMLATNSDWVTREIRTLVPIKATSLTLNAGLQFASGTMDFDDVEVSVLDADESRKRPLLSAGQVIDGGRTVVFAEEFNDLDSERRPVGWDTTSFNYFVLHRGRFTPHREGSNQFFRIENTDPQESVYLQKFMPVKPAWTQLTASFRLRTLDLNAKSGDASLFLEWVDSKMNSVGGIGGIGTKLEQDWVVRRVTSSVTIPPQAAYLRVRVGLMEARGKIDVDDVNIFATEDPAK